MIRNLLSTSAKYPYLKKGKQKKIKIKNGDKQKKKRRESKVKGANKE